MSHVTPYNPFQTITKGILLQLEGSPSTALVDAFGEHDLKLRF